MSTPLRLVTATDTAADFGAACAINSPPVNSPRERAINSPGSFTDQPRKYTWQSATPAARRVIEHMRVCTPKGAAPPWRSGPSVTAAQRLLDDGIPEADLLSLIEDASRIVSNGSGTQGPEWWYPQNLFEGGSAPRWLADIAAFRITREAADKRSLELEALEKHGLEEREAAKAPQVQDLRIRRLGDELLASLSDPARLARARGDGHGT